MFDVLKIKELRRKTQAGLNVCIQALADSLGDVTLALSLLEKRGYKHSALSDKYTLSEGKIHSYIHHDSKKACLVEVLCETKSALQDPKFIDFCDTLGFQIVSMKPRWLSVSDIPKDKFDDKKVELSSNYDVNDPDRIHKINLDLKRWFSEVCLMNQKAIRYDDKTIDQLREDIAFHLKQRIVVTRFVNWELGE